MAGLEIIIGANKDDFDKKIKEVEFDIKELSKEKATQIKLGLDTTEINKNIKDAKKSLTDLKTTVRDTGGAFGKDFAPKVANGGNALMQFSRIAQDAPYGIIGIGNNISATAEAFSHLKNQTGSTGGALKALASSITGTGGVLLGVSLLTTGLTLMSQSGLSVSDAFNKLTGNFNQFKQSLSEANSEAAKNSASEISLMNANVAAARNLKLEMSDRLLAVKALQSEYPAYFGNLTQEQILNGNVAGAVRDVTSALVQKAKVAAYTSKITDLAKEEFQIQEKIRASYSDIFSRFKLTEAQKVEFLQALNKTGREGDAVVQKYLKTLGVVDFYKAFSQVNTYKDLREELKQNVLEQAKFTKEINKSYEAQIKLSTVVPKQKKTYNTPQVSPLQSNIAPAGLEDLSGQVVQIAKNIKGAEGVITTSLSNIKVAFDTSTIEMMQIMADFNQQFNDIINTGIVGTFSDLASIIGEGLANGANVLQSIGKTLLSSFGGIMSELGKLLIKTGVGILAAKLALKSLNPYLAIAGGIALVAAGAAFSSGASNLSNSIGGGSGGSSGGSISSGSSYSSPASYSGGSTSTFNGGTVVFEISGQSLIGVLSNTLDKNKRLGGGVTSI
jgi:hypothetical protein